MTSIKRLIKATFIYDMIKSSKAKRNLARWTPHDQEMFDFYRQFLSPGELCFDVGANVGNRVKVFLRLKARVIAIEPQLYCARVLRAVYGSDPQLTVVQKALGESEGEAEMMISEAGTISTLSREWMEAVRRSGRFSDFRWDKKRTIRLTTLDRLIQQYGQPAFVKIDVEGFECQVIKGLTQRVMALSLEFTPELLEPTFECFEHLQRLGDIRLNYSLSETMRLALQEWVSPPEMVRVLSTLKGDAQVFGDVYVRFVGAS